MKTAVLVFAISLFSFGASYASTNPNLKKEITKKVTIDLKQEGVSFSDKDFVKVSFTIDNGEILILELNATQEVLKELIIRELKEIHVQSEYGFNETYNYKFTFSKA